MVLWAAAAKAVLPDYLTTPFDELCEQAKKDGKLIFVSIGREKCGLCQKYYKMMREDQIRIDTNRFEIVRLDIDNEEHRGYFMSVFEPDTQWLPFVGVMNGDMQEVVPCLSGRRNSDAARYQKLVDACSKGGYVALGQAPAQVVLEGEGVTNAMKQAGYKWSANGVTVVTEPLAENKLRVTLEAPHMGVSTLRLKWNVRSSGKTLQDSWERSYGKLGWYEIDAARPLPWFTIVTEGADAAAYGYGVMVQPNALACWYVGPEELQLVLDVRAGSQPVQLGPRKLEVCTVVSRKSKEGESTFAAAQEFCRMMCPKPRLPKETIYGYNDWYCAYGRNTATNFLADAAYIAECAAGLANRPYVVMDDGWQKNSPPVVKVDSGYGPWDEAGAPFGMKMKEFCSKVAALNAKPGLWYRPFRAWDEMCADWKLKDDPRYVDPTVAAVKELVRNDILRFREWGFKLVKIDYLTFDLNRIWGSQMKGQVIVDNRNWRDASRTTAEVVLDYYRTMREAAGDDMVIIGCNALNHMAAGIFEIQRTGDDTSGRKWERTKQMGPNTLGFRAFMHEIFYVADADCVGLAAAGAVPWEKNSQWLDLVANSGTALFVSWHRALATPEVRAALTRAFTQASQRQPIGRPLDWFTTTIPATWQFGNETKTYNW